MRTEFDPSRVFCILANKKINLSTTYEVAKDILTRKEQFCRSI